MTETLQDFDEIIVPQKGLSSWSDMMKAIEKNGKKVYTGEEHMDSVSKVTREGIGRIHSISSKVDLMVTEWRFPYYFFVPPKDKGGLPMMDTSLRDTGTGGKGKSMFRTANVLKVYNHGVSKSLDGTINTVIVNDKFGKIHHYRDQVMEGWEYPRQQKLLKVILDINQIYLQLFL